VATRGGDRATPRYIGYRGFELTGDFCHRGIRNSENVRMDQDRPSVGIWGGDPDYWGKSR
jgi:hypothetical protein